MVVLFVPIVLFPFWFTLTPSPPPHAELQILKYSGSLSLDSSFTQMSTPPEILSRVQGLKIAFNWSIYLFSIFSPYLFSELTHKVGYIWWLRSSGNLLISELNLSLVVLKCSPPHQLLLLWWFVFSFASLFCCWWWWW